MNEQQLITQISKASYAKQTVEQNQSSNQQLKELNDKVASQTYRIVRLEDDLKQETQEPKEADNHISNKEIILAIVATLFGAISTEFIHVIIPLSSH